MADGFSIDSETAELADVPGFTTGAAACGLAPEGLEGGYRNGVTVVVEGDAAHPFVVPTAGPERGLVVDIGEHDADGTLELTFADPQGGVAIRGFRAEAVDRDAGAPAQQFDERLTSQLRALGYVDD